MINSKEKIQYAAEIENVKELRLIGKANFNYWKEYLSKRELFPFNKNGFAEITISATDLKWKGVRFNELVITIATSKGKDLNEHNGFYLLQAFNSVRFFAFCERVFFFTPYHHGIEGLKEQLPFSMQLEINSQIVLRAEMKEKDSMVSFVFEN